MIDFEEGNKRLMLKVVVERNSSLVLFRQITMNIRLEGPRNFFNHIQSVTMFVTRLVILKNAIKPVVCEKKLASLATK